MSGIREARLQDLDELLRLKHQLSPLTEKGGGIDRARLKAILEKMIKDERYVLLVFERNGRLLATGTLLVQLNLSHAGRPYAHIENLVVDEKHREKGIGKRIVERLIEEARQFNCYKVVLGCKKHNIPFYQKAGLIEKGVVMRLDL